MPNQHEASADVLAALDAVIAQLENERGDARRLFARLHGTEAEAIALELKALDDKLSEALRKREELSKRAERASPLVEHSGEQAIAGDEGRDRALTRGGDRDGRELHLPIDGVDHLSREGAEEFARLGVSVAVSLDGTREAHDRGRPTRGGGPSYDAALAGIDALRAAGVGFALQRRPLERRRRTERQALPPTQAPFTLAVVVDAGKEALATIYPAPVMAREMPAGVPPVEPHHGCCGGAHATVASNKENAPALGATAAAVLALLLRRRSV
jgi:hypothetical protein